MAPTIVDKSQIESFPSEAAFEAWLAKHHDTHSSASEATLPGDLRAAIEASPRARAAVQTLGRANLFALAFRTSHTKTAAGRAKKIASLVAMLARGETIVPEAKARGDGARSAKVVGSAKPRSAKAPPSTKATRSSTLSRSKKKPIGRGRPSS